MRTATFLTASLLALSVLSGGPACGISDGVAEPKCPCAQTSIAASGKYVFASGKSSMTMASGWTGLRRVYSIEGWFLLKVDSAAGTARFARVAAILVDPAGVQPDRSLDEQFDLTGLAGTILDDGSIQFEGEVNGAGSISITLVCKADGVHLTGKTTPPPGSADFPIFTLDAVAVCQCPCDNCLAASSEYVFTSDAGTVTQTGGIAGIRRTYSIVGSFQLSVDPSAGTAWFTRVDASLLDDKGEAWSHDLNDVFNLTGLAGVVADGGKSVRFGGQADDASSVVITLTFTDGAAALKGETTPPPHSADFFIFTLDATAQRKYAGGAGTADDPYQIATAADLIALGQTPADSGKHFMLTADIDLDPNLPGRKVFAKAIIGSFTGVFTGNGHTISHLTIKGGTYYLGLLGELEPGAEVKDLGVVDVNIDGSGSCVGGLVGQNVGTLTRCYSTGTVSGRERIGGLVGQNTALLWPGLVRDCYSSGKVSGDASVGGLVGWNGEPGIISDCYSTSTVTGNNSVGGLMGMNGGHIIHCYATGVVSGSGDIGGVVGSGWVVVGGDMGWEIRGIAAACFWDTQTSGQAASAGGTGKTTAEMQTASTFLDAGWDFVGEMGNGTEDIWWIFDGRDYPRLSWERVLDDDFEDCRAEPLWMSYEPEPELVQLLEVNGRLEVEAVAQTEDVDAIYVANGWRLDVTKDFALRVDFHFSKRGVGDGRVTLGVVPSLDPSGMRWAEFEAGCFDADPFYLYEVRDGFWVQERVTTRSSDDGTLYMSYNPDTDELYFSRTGYGKASAWQTVPGLLKGRWAAEAVYVILSGGSEGMALDPGDAWLDNLIINAGAIVK